MAGKKWTVSYKDAAAVNATRYAIGDVVKQHLSTQFWSGSRTKKNRIEQGYAKDHWVDAACVGEAGANVALESSQCFIASAKGHGSRQMCRMDKYGFPRTSAKGSRTIHGFKSGDLVKAIVPKGKKAGTHEGRVAVRSNGFFNITTPQGVVQGIGHKHCQITHKGDGYAYSLTTTVTKETREQTEKQAA